MATQTGGRRVLVTGGAGFIGSAISRRLAAEAARWVVVDSLHPQVHVRRERPEELHPAAELIVGDVADPALWDRLIADLKPEVVLHLAAETGTAQSLTEAGRHAETNVLGTARLTDALSRAGVSPSRVLLSSSRAVYGEGRWKAEDGSVFYPPMRTHEQLARAEWDYPGASPLPSSAETTEPRPVNVYAATKLAQEQLLRAWGGAMDVPVTVLRFQNVYGPGQSLTNPYTGIVSLFSQWAEAGRSIPVYEDGGIVRDFVFIDDVVAAVEAALDAPTAEGVFDVGSGTATTILELAQTIAAYYGAPEPQITGQFRDGDVRSASCTIDTTVAALGWRPRIELAAGVRALQEWIARQSSRVARD